MKFATDLKSTARAVYHWPGGPDASRGTASVVFQARQKYHNHSIFRDDVTAQCSASGVYKKLAKLVVYNMTLSVTDWEKDHDLKVAFPTEELSSYPIGALWINWAHAGHRWHESKSPDEIRYDQLTAKSFSEGLDATETNELEQITSRLDDADALDLGLVGTSKRIKAGYDQLRADLAAINATLDRHLAK